MKRITTLLLSLFLPVALYAAWPSGSGGGGGTAATWPVSGTPAGFADGIDDAGGSANLAVGTGTAAGFGVAITSPTAAINFDRTIFAGTLTGGGTAYITISAIPAATISAGALGASVLASSITLAAMYGSPTLTGTNITGIPGGNLTGTVPTSVLPSTITYTISTQTISGAKIFSSSDGTLFNNQVTVQSSVTISGGPLEISGTDSALLSTQTVVWISAQSPTSTDAFKVWGTSVAVKGLLEVGTGIKFPDGTIQVTSATNSGGGGGTGDMILATTQTVTAYHPMTSTAGQNITGQLTVGSSVTFTNSAFSVASNRFLVNNNQVSMGADPLNPTSRLTAWHLQNPSQTSFSFAVDGFYSAPTTGTAVTGGLQGFATNTDETGAAPSGAHNIGVIGVATDRFNSLAPLYGVEGRLNMRGQADRNAAVLALAVRNSSAPVTDKIYGVWVRMEDYTDSAATQLQSSNTFTQMFLDNPLGGAKWYGIVQRSTATFNYFGSPTVVGASSSTVLTHNAWLDVMNPPGDNQSLMFLRSSSTAQYPYWQMGRGSQIDFTMGIATPAASFFSDSQVGDVIFRADQGGRILLGSGTGTPKSDTTITSTGTTTIGLRVSSGVVSSGTLFAVSTGPVDLFSVLATSANIKVPVFLNGGGVFNVGALTDFLSGFNLAHSTLIISIPISSVTASMSIDLGPISGQSQATITQIAATTLPTGTTGLFQLDYRSTTTIGTAGTSVFTVSYATATSPGKVYVSADFASAAIPKDYHLVLTTHPTTPQTGGVTNATVVLYYKEQ